MRGVADVMEVLVGGIAGLMEVVMRGVADVMEVLVRGVAGSSARHGSRSIAGTAETCRSSRRQNL